jgi:sigma-B regulation protein RsbU (phosphoserine phosphatase)
VKDKRQILIVEDEEHTRYLLERLLVVNNFTVRTAENGIDALNTMTTFKPEIILADWNMPEMDGAELCQRIKTNPDLKHIYFIMITAKTSTQEKVIGLDTGADDYITKPVENEELLARIRSGLRIYDLQQEIRQLEHEKALLEMAATLGHQMNNPLSAVNLALVSLKKNIQDKNFKEIDDDIKLIQQSVQRMQEITQKLMMLKDPKLVTYLDNLKMLKL